MSPTPLHACGHAEREVRIRSNTEPVGAIEHHRLPLRRRYQQVFEFSEYVWTNRITLVACQQKAVSALVDENVEVVEPEVGHHFVELALTVDRSQQFGLHQLIDRDLLGIAK